MANYQLTQTGAEVQSLLNKVASPDTTPISSSSALITSGGVKTYVDGHVSVSQNTTTGHADITVGDTTTPVASVDDVERAYYNFDADVSKQIPMESGYIACGGSAGTVVNLTPVSHSSYKHAVVDCKEGDIFYVQGKGGNSDRLYCFINSSNAIIRSASAGTDIQLLMKIIAPAGTAKMILNDEASGLVSWYGEKVLSGVSRELYHFADICFDTDMVYTIDQAGKYYNSSKQLITSSAFNVAKVDVDGRDSILVRLRAGELSCSYWADVQGGLTYAFNGSQSDGINVNLALVVPTYAKYLYISYVSSSGLIVKTYGQKNIFEELDKLSERVNAELLYDSTVTGKYLDVNGVEQSSSTLAIDKYNVVKCSKIHIKARIGTPMYVIFYDSSDNILTKYAGNANEGVNVDSDYNVPENASYVRISYATDYPCIVSLVSQSLQSQIDTINETIGGDLEYDSVVNGKYLDSSGAEQTLSSYKIYKYLIVGELKKIHLKVRMGEAAYSKFYDKDDSIVGSIQGNSAEGLNIDSDYDVPNGATYIRVSSSNEAICEVTPVGDGLRQTVADLQKRINRIDDNLWQGKKIGLLGDSIAAGSASSSVAQRFINVAATYLGASVKNAAIGGWYLGDEEGKSIYRQVNGVSPATTSLDGDEDLVVIFAGTNDFGHAFTIGSAYTEVTSNGVTRKVPSTIDTETCGGLIKTIQTLYTKYGGYVPIVICTPIQRYASGGDSPETGYAPLGPWAKNSAGKYLDDYIDGIKSVATLYGIPVFDAYHNNMNPNIAAACTKYFGTTSNPSGDGLHPNDAGHELLGKQLAFFLKTHFFDV